LGGRCLVRFLRTGLLCGVRVDITVGPMKDRRRAFVVFFHGWEGFHRKGGPIAVEQTLGFVTVGYMPRDLWKQINALKDQLEKLAGRKP